MRTLKLLNILLILFLVGLVSGKVGYHYGRQQNSPHPAIADPALASTLGAQELPPPDLALLAPPFSAESAIPKPNPEGLIPKLPKGEPALTGDDEMINLLQRFADVQEPKLRANLYCIIAAHANGDDAKLGVLLKAYAEKRIRELENQDNELNPEWQEDPQPDPEHAAPPAPPRQPGIQMSKDI
jgi:hypothetical protein